MKLLIIMNLNIFEFIMETYITPIDNNSEDMYSRRYVNIEGPFQTKAEANAFIKHLCTNSNQYIHPSQICYPAIYPIRDNDIFATGFYVMMSAYMHRNRVIIATPIVNTSNGEKRIQILFVKYFESHLPNEA